MSFPSRRDFLVTAAGALAALAGCKRTSVASGPSDKPYLERLASFRTKLTRVGPAPQSAENTAPPEGVREIQYRSGALDLPAWLKIAPDAPSKAPAVVYFHGGFAFGPGDFEDALPLGERRALLCPTLRAENGNPGTFEMFLSELEDAAAAVRWLAAQTFVDPERIYTFGHSAGGLISALLSLRDGVPCKHGGSSGGLYDDQLFSGMEETPFDPREATECRMRLLVGNVRWMRRRHYAYCGKDDRWQAVQAARRESGTSSLLSIKEFPGDHFTSLAPAIAAYAALIAQEG